MKSEALLCLRSMGRSPSPRRAWIEMKLLYINGFEIFVALPTEGVD